MTIPDYSPKYYKQLYKSYNFIQILAHIHFIIIRLRRYNPPTEKKMVQRLDLGT